MRIITIPPFCLLLFVTHSILTSNLVYAQPIPVVDKVLTPAATATSKNEAPPPWEARPDAVERSAQAEATSADTPEDSSSSVESWYRNRKRLSANVEDEFTTLKADALKGKPDVQYRLALLYRSDDNPQADLKQSIDWQQKAAQAGYAEAQYGLGMLYANGQFVPQDYVKARDWLQKAASQGHTAARLAIASVPEVVEQRERISAAPLAKDAPHSTKTAALPKLADKVPSLASTQTTKNSSIQAPTQAPTVAANVAKRPMPISQAQATIADKTTTQPTPTQPPKPPKSTKTALAQAPEAPVISPHAEEPPIESNTSAQADEAVQEANPIQLVATTSTISADDVATLKQAAAAGDNKAQLMLGTLYEDGTGGLPQDLRQAAHWYKEAAKNGYVNAQYNLGLLYEDGRGVKQDYDQAAFWYEKAAKAGFTEAKNNLGVLYVLGSGVKKDPKQAEKLFREAAAKGNADAQRNLAMLVKGG